MANEWWKPLREVNERYFDGPFPDVAWDDHVATLNADFALEPPHKLATCSQPDMPPAWFIGDVASMAPEKWVLVLSLNPAEDDDVDYWTKQEWDADSFWECLTDVNNWWNRRFHPPLAYLASQALSIALGEPNEFATNHMIFAELCPYMSKSFPTGSLRELYSTDIACKVEAEMVDPMMAKGQPGLVLVNGTDAVQNFDATFGEALSWQEKTYLSDFKPGKRLWHMEGLLRMTDRVTPVMGFPFLRKPSTHNATVEIEQLARFARALVGAGS